MKKKTIWIVTAIVAVVLIALMGASCYMLDYALAPNPDRADTDSCYRKLFSEYPETQPWVDSLRKAQALRDTFIVMPSGERHHALYINNGSERTALVLHGWRNCSVDILFIARIYDRELGGYNVVVPDIHAHGQSEGDRIRMGWKDRLDQLHWLEVFQTDTMVVHGISMGGATTMMLSGETMPQGVKDIHFIDDCGYTSVWDEFTGELDSQFGLPAFPLLYTTSLLSKLTDGWSFQEASALNAVSTSPYPMLFIHGEADTFVPTEMVYRLYEAKQEPKDLWVATGAIHGQSYKLFRKEYVERVREFMKR